MLPQDEARQHEAHVAVSAEGGGGNSVGYTIIVAVQHARYKPFFFELARRRLVMNTDAISSGFDRQRGSRGCGMAMGATLMCQIKACNELTVYAVFLADSFTHSC